MLFRVALIITLSLSIAACKVDGETGDALVAKALPGNYRDVLENSDKFELLTLACPNEVLPEGFDGTDTIGPRYRIVNRRDIDDPELRLTLVSAFYDAVKAGEDNVGTACFEPHHGIRATKGSETVTILVCFMCHNFYVLPDGVKNGIRIPLAPLEVWRSEVKRLGMAQVAKSSMTGRAP
jgi:hypothetical protein